MAWTIEERKQLEQFLKDGKTVKDISIILNRNYFCVRNEVYKGGTTKNYSHAHALKPRPIKYLTYEEKEKIRSLFLAGYTFVKISKILNRSVQTVTCHIKTHCNDLYREMKIKDPELPLVFKEQNSNSNLEERINILEEQIKILKEVMEKLYDSKN